MFGRREERVVQIDQNVEDIDLKSSRETMSRLHEDDVCFLGQVVSIRFFVLSSTSK